jgi:hypothetical protein
MRRSFNKALCISTPPPKAQQIPPARKQKKPIKENRRISPMLKGLFDDYIELIGDNFNLKELAYKTGVKTNTARLWTHGYRPHELVWFTIARYFAQFLTISPQMIFEDIKFTIRHDKRKQP